MCLYACVAVKWLLEDSDLLLILLYSANVCVHFKAITFTLAAEAAKKRYSPGVLIHSWWELDYFECHK